MKVLKWTTILLLLTFTVFTALLLTNHLSEAGYIVLVIALIIFGVALYFSDRVKEVDLKKAVVKLYERSREGLTLDKLAIDVGTILSMLSMASAGTAKQREKREGLIVELLKSAKASEKEREKILEDAKLITKLMAAKDEAQIDILRKEIESKGLLD